MANEAIQTLLSRTLDFCTECVNAGHLCEARNALTRALNMAPDQPEILTQRGRIALLLKDLEVARRDFESALRVDDRCAPAHSGLARYHFEQGRLSEAEQAAQLAKAMDPGDEDAAIVLSDIQRQRPTKQAIRSSPGQRAKGVERVCPPIGRVAGPNFNQRAASAPPRRAHGREAFIAGVPAPQSTPASNGSFTSPSHPTPPPEPAVDRDAAEQSRAALNQFHSNAADYFADVVPPQLSEMHLANSRVLPSREHILPLMPKGGVCAEVGTQTGAFAKLILSILRPAKLHIYDIDYTPFDHAHFQTSVHKGIVELHKGDSSTLLGQLPDRHFDFIYIDGDHSYEGVVKDLDQAARKIKEDGWIVCNDYTIYSPLEKIKYGVYRAVNELCHNRGFQIIFLGLHLWGYHDVALRKM